MNLSKRDFLKKLGLISAAGAAGAAAIAAARTGAKVALVEKDGCHLG